MKSKIAALLMFLVLSAFILRFGEMTRTLPGVSTCQAADCPRRLFTEIGFS
jgi:hypothetical protein